MTLVALLQARDEEPNLSGWLTNITPCVDTIVALDDGSTDATAAILEAHPKVARLLRNPPGKPWDERANQVALVKAAREFGEWALAIDADERLETRFADAAPSLLRQAQADGIDCLCFSLRELWGDRNHYRIDGKWSRRTRYRLFRNDPAHRRFDPRPLHRFWMPLDIAINIETCGRHTGFNIYHLSMIERAKREARVQRYESLDPHHLYQSIGYAYLADERGLQVEAIPEGRDYLPASIGSF